MTGVETLYREWTRAGVRAISVSKAMLDDSLSGRLLRTILAAFSEYERSVIALRTSSGRKQRVATQGSFHGGGVPYGYCAVGNRRSLGHGVCRLTSGRRQQFAWRFVSTIRRSSRSRRSPSS